MKVLFLTTALPSGRRSGGELVSQGIVSILRDAGHDVSVLGYLPPAQDALDHETPVGRRPIETSGAGARPLGWMLRALVTGAPYSSAKYRSRAYGRAVREATAEGPDVVVIDHAQVAFLLDAPLPAALPVVFVAHNAESPLYRALAGSTRSRLRRWMYGREAALLEALERTIPPRVRQVWALTDADAAYFRSLYAAADVRVLEIAPTFEPLHRPAEYDVALLGNWIWDANKAGLDWFVDEVAPLVDGEMTIAVGGAGSEHLRGKNPNVSGCGVVPDAREFLARARVLAVPAVTGGGTQVKTLDAISSGKPVVATSVAVRGLGELPGAVAVADDAADFARGLRRLAVGGPRLENEASEWSLSRRRRFEANVTAWIEALAPPRRGAIDAPVAAAPGSGSRPA